MTDYPDWQVSAATQSANQFPAFTQTLAPGAHPGLVVPVLSWSSLSLIVVPTAGAGKVSVTHWADALGTQRIGTDTWPVNTATALAVRVPLRGPYAQLSINVTSPGNLTSETWAVWQTAPADKISFPVSNQQITDSRTLAASASVNLPIPLICCGPATWSYNPFDATGKLAVQVQAVDELGSLLTIVSNRGNPVALDNALLNIPDQIINVNITNTDAGAGHGYGFCLTVPPY